MTYANDQVCIGDDGSLWILADLWRCRDSGGIAGLVWNDARIDDESDWLPESFYLRASESVLQ